MTRNRPKGDRVLAQYDMKGNLIHTWGTCKEAAKEYGLEASKISQSARGQRKGYGGFNWAYLKRKTVPDESDNSLVCNI